MAISCTDPRSHTRPHPPTGHPAHIPSPIHLVPTWDPIMSDTLTSLWYPAPFPEPPRWATSKCSCPTLWPPHPRQRLDLSHSCHQSHLLRAISTTTVTHWTLCPSLVSLLVDHLLRHLVTPRRPRPTSHGPTCTTRTGVASKPWWSHTRARSGTKGTTLISE